MSLEIKVSRKLIHRREIKCYGYLREDGLWDIEAHLTDAKEHSIRSAQRGEIAAGENVHDIWLRLTVDEKLIIHEVEASTDMAPFSICAGANSWYKKLEGKQIAAGWNLMVKKLFAGVNGCTHLTELLAVIATTAIQSIYPYLGMQQKKVDSPGKLSSSLPNSCHGFNTEGEIIARFWPDLKNSSK